MSRILTFETTGNDNYLEMETRWGQVIYEGMKSQGMHCRVEGCFCAYSHYGWCNKCGHYTEKLMLPPAKMARVHPNGDEVERFPRVPAGALNVDVRRDWCGDYWCDCVQVIVSVGVPDGHPMIDLKRFPRARRIGIWHGTYTTGDNPEPGAVEAEYAAACMRYGVNP